MQSVSRSNPAFSGLGPGGKLRSIDERIAYLSPITKTSEAELSDAVNRSKSDGVVKSWDDAAARRSKHRGYFRAAVAGGVLVVLAVTIGLIASYAASNNGGGGLVSPTSPSLQQSRALETLDLNVLATLSGALPAEFASPTSQASLDFCSGVEAVSSLPAGSCTVVSAREASGSGSSTVAVSFQLSVPDSFHSELGPDEIVAELEAEVNDAARSGELLRTITALTATDSFQMVTEVGGVQVDVVASPSPSALASPSTPSSQTWSSSPSATTSRDPLVTPSSTASSTPSSSMTASSSPSGTPSATTSATPSSSVTPTPSSSVTPSSTASPSASPSPSPMQIVVVTPGDKHHVVSIKAGMAEIRRSGVGEVILLSHSDAVSLTASNTTSSMPTMSSVPCGRSYDGLDWEAVPPGFCQFDCSLSSGASAPASNCVISLPDDRFVARSIMTVPVSEKQRMARHMLRATFGSSAQEIDSALAITTTGTFEEKAAAWMHSQMELPMTSHRAYFRHRANARNADPVVAGGVRGACELSSRWVRYAITATDEDQSMELRGDTLYVDGHPRTLAPPGFDASMSSAGSQPWTICTVTESVGGAVRVGSSCSVTILNPAVTFGSTMGPQGRVMHRLATFSEVQQPATDALLLSASTNLRKCSPPGAGPVFATIPPSSSGANVSWVMHDSRLRFVRNTINAPANMSYQSDIACPKVRKNFFNAKSCVPAQKGCYPMQYTPVKFQLNATVIRAFYELSGRHIHYVTGLRIDEQKAPCSDSTTRWMRMTGDACADSQQAGTANLDAGTLAFLQGLIQAADDGLPVVNIRSRNGQCTTAALGVMINVTNIPANRTECWRHSHIDLLSVRDFSYWTRRHDGNRNARAGNRPNPIARIADTLGSAEFAYPRSHTMKRWNDNDHRIAVLGRFNEQLTFDQLPFEYQIPAVAAFLGAEEIAPIDDGFEACGSPFEVANEPEKGYLYIAGVAGLDDSRLLQRADQFLHGTITTPTKTRVWTNAVVKAPDQLRQRVAWALAQIFVVSEMGVNIPHYSEMYNVYTDIFVRNAFGNFRDTLAEVSFSPAMARMLTFDANRALEYSLRSGKQLYPDENYAREIMQLFTIGLWKLNQDGTYERDLTTGELVPTYGTEDILDLARLWTGFSLQPIRQNTAMVDGIFTANRIDPLRIRPELHDAFPKRAVDGSYVGDRHPLCAHLPPRMFLRKGAIYRYLGTKPAPFLHADIDPDTVTIRGSPWMVLASEESALHSLLCDRSSATGMCQLRSQIVLQSNLACHGIECDADTVRVVRVNRSNHQLPVFYEYLRPPCVEMAFTDRAYATIDRRGSKTICVDERLPAAAEVCCNPGSTQGYSQTGTYDEERITRLTAVERCAARGMEVCHTTRISRPYSYTVNSWSSRPCKLQAQIQPTGRVTSVQTMPDDQWQGFRDSRVGLDTLFGFRVNWQDNSFPLVEGAQYPAGECVERGESLLCNITVETSTVFEGHLPSNMSELVSRLDIGHADPAALDSGMLSECTTPACTKLASVHGVTVYVNDSTSQAINEASVFRVTIAGKVYFLANRLSMVRIGGGESSVSSFAFRNPPSFMSLWEQTGRDAHWEIEASLDTYVAHPNVAPFISDLLIKRMVSSNPSPGYVKRVATAFKAGSHKGFGTGNYGDMAATVAAILLDTEAISTAIEADPMHGRVREPLMKLLNMFRGLKYTPSGGREIDLNAMHLRLGMMAHLADSVFNFYQSDYQPVGAVSRASLVSPEMQIINTPTVVSWLNGIMSLGEYGLTDCDRGFGRRAYANPGCGSVQSGSRPGSDYWAGGLLWNQTDAGGMDADTVVNAADLVLTGGRLSEHSRRVISTAYTEMLHTGGAEKAIRSVIELFGVTPEFSISSLHEPLNHTLASEVAGVAAEMAPSPSPSPQPSLSNSSDYKAIVYLYLAGGADSHNFLIPESACTELAAQYAAVRTVVALDPDAQIEAPVPPGSQPCSKFMMHAQLTKFKQLYDAGQSAFVANIGPLIQPVTKQQFQSGTAKLPPGLTAHNVQTRATMSVHAQSTSPLGVLGRIRDALLGIGVESSAYSISGSSLVLKGESAAPPGDIVDRSNGAVRFDETNLVSHLRPHIDALVNNGSTSMMGDAWTRSVNTGLSRSEQLADSLTTAGALKQPFEALTIDTSTLSKQLEQAAKLVAARKFLGSKRDVFFVQIGGFDTHGDAFSVMDTKLMQIDASINSFVEEMKLQGVWDGVTIVTASEFARTITSNGAGTDHGWGGITMLAGGALRGGQIFGQYPSDITEAGPHNIGRGRLIPTTPWEAVWGGIASWFGVPESSMEQVLPHIGNFPKDALFNTSRLYHHRD